MGSLNFLQKIIYAENKNLQLNLQFKKQNLQQSCKSISLLLEKKKKKVQPKLEYFN